MKLAYAEVLKEEKYVNEQERLIEIYRLEQKLFKSIAIEQSSNDDKQRNYLNGRIDSLQDQYAKIHI